MNKSNNSKECLHGRLPEDFSVCKTCAQIVDCPLFPRRFTEKTYGCEVQILIFPRPPFDPDLPA